MDTPPIPETAKAFFALGHKLAAECARAQNPDHCPLCGTPARVYYSRTNDARLSTLPHGPQQPGRVDALLRRHHRPQCLDRCMNSHILLHDYNDDTAKLMTNAETPFFWVLDLEDPAAFELAVASGKTAASLIDHRQSILATGCIAALTLGLSLPASNEILAVGWSVPPLPTGSRYLAVVSEGRVTVRFLT